MGAIGPGGSRDLPGRVALEPGESGAGGPSLLVAAQGAAVGPIGGARAPAPAPAVAHGAFVPLSIFGRAVAEDGGPESGITGRPCGPDVVCTVDGGATAYGSRSQLNKEPNGKCCTTGNLDKTSALYILIMPW